MSNKYGDIHLVAMNWKLFLCKNLKNWNFLFEAFYAFDIFQFRRLYNENYNINGLESFKSASIVAKMLKALVTCCTNFQLSLSFQRKHYDYFPYKFD